MDVPVLLAFNRGVISRFGLARVDLNRTALSAAVQTNWMPRTLGPMMLRAGLEHTGARLDNNKSKSIDFVYDPADADDVAEIEITDGKMRVWVDDELVTRASVSSAVTNGAFTSDVANWTDADESGATSAFVTGGYLGLTGNGTAAAIRRQEVTVAGGDQNTTHALDIVIERGPVTFRVGSSAGDDDYVSETTLRTGVHSLAFTPSGNFHIQFSNRNARQVLVDSVAVASSGVMELTAPWAEADLFELRWTQSGDVVFVACDGYQQRRIERRSVTSWSIVFYESENGPYRLENTGPTTLAANAITGNITLTASIGLFQSGHVGALFQHTSKGQRVEADVSAENNFTSSIRVTGVGSSRAFNIERAGTWTATVTLQRSIGEEGNWEDVSGKTYTTNGTETGYNDGLDNQIVFYRLGVKTGDFTSDTAELALDYALGSITGVVRITAVASETSASAEVLSDLGGTTATDVWREGAWSTYRGWPTATRLYNGRLWWLGRDYYWGSVSDAYDSFDPDVEGDSGPISRSIGEGPVDNIRWAIGARGLLTGGGGAEYHAYAPLDDTITPTAFKLDVPSNQGSAKVGAVKVDKAAIFVSRAGSRVYEMAPDTTQTTYDTGDLTALVPEIGEPGVTTMAVQRQPDTRVHCVRSDGDVAVLVTDRAEEVRCWIPVETPGGAGIVEDVCVLPGAEEDQVIYTVRRTVDGNTVRYREKWALERECRGHTHEYSGASTTTITDIEYRDGTVLTARDADGDKIENVTVSGRSVTMSSAVTYASLTPAAIKCADSFVAYSGAATGTMTGLDHLEGLDVVVWADGVCLTDASGDIATFTVSSGQISLTDEGAAITAEVIVAGLAYEARFKSSKLAYASQVGTALTQRKTVERVGLVLADTHARGIKIGAVSFDDDDLDPLPTTEDGAPVDPDYMWYEYDKETTSITSTWDTDTRIYMKAFAPRPAVVTAISFQIQTNS